jgi:uncharacterized membrane protein YccC
MNLRLAWNWAATEVKAYRAQLGFCLRMTAAALLAFALTQLLAIPLHGLWAVLTAVVVTQISVGGSLRATAEYVVGTLGGVAYATLVGVLVPHTTPLALAGVLALTVAPLAGAAALNPSFRVAPFTGVIVLLISNELGEGPLESALYRLLEVALGGAVAVTVSLLVFPERAYGLGLDAAARALDQLAQVLPELLALSRKLDLDEVRRIQDATGEAVANCQAIAAEAKRERFVNLGAEPDPGPLARTLLRLRHDLVIIGRAAVVPLPDVLLGRLGPLLERLGASASEYLRGSAGALRSRCSPPPLDPITTAFEAYTSEIAALRHQGLTRSLSSSEVERLFALGFGLEQMHRNFVDLARCVEEGARPRGKAKAGAPVEPIEKEAAHMER